LQNSKEKTPNVNTASSKEKMIENKESEMPKPAILKDKNGQLSLGVLKEEDYQVRILMIVGWVLIASGVLLTIADIILAQAPFSSLDSEGFHLLNLLVVIIGGMVVGLVRSGHTHTATHLLLIGLLLVLASQFYLEGQPMFDVAGQLGLILVIVLTSVLLDIRKVWIISAITSIIFIGILILWFYNLLPKPVDREPFNGLIFTLISWMGVAGMITAVISSTMQSRQKYRRYLENMLTEGARQLDEAQEKLLRQEHLAALGQLAGSIGHELRNPLAVMKNAVHFLKLTQPATDGKMREYLGIIEDEIRSADKIITDLLEFSRAKSLDLKAVSVERLLQAVLERHPAPVGISIALDIASELPPVYVDPGHIEQVLGNLVVNAYQAMPPSASPPPVLSEVERSGGTEGGVLTVSAKVAETQIKVSISDTGMGIPPENIDKIFEPLFTTKAKGIGLGLAVSQNLVEANGGTIEVQSKVGIGTTFILGLPCVTSAGKGEKP
jgi:signal transduction histidine kinase